MAEVDLNEVERYLRIFQENPDSRVFAPLADMYRRLGRLREAEDICREGLLRHPYYAGGKVALAHILLEAGRLEEALKEAESVVTYYPDNLLARKILIRVLGGLNQLDNARREYEALKHLAPLVAGDPELERALQGRAHVEELPAMPMSRPAGAILKPIQIQEKTDWDANFPATPMSPPAATASSLREISPAVERSQKLSALLRKKLILESLVKACS